MQTPAISKTEERSSPFLQPSPIGNGVSSFEPPAVFLSTSPGDAWRGSPGGTGAGVSELVLHLLLVQNDHR